MLQQIWRSTELRRNLWTILTFLVTGIALYTLAGFLVAPQLVKRWIETVITADSGGRLEAERIAFNPYTFEVSFTNLTLYDGENKAAFSIGRSEAVLDLRSLSEQRPIFSGTVELTAVEASPATAGEFYLAVRRIAADGAALHPGAATVERLHIDEPEMHLRRNSTGELNLPAVLRQLLVDTAAGRLEFDAMDFNDGRLRFLDDAVSPPARFDADAVNARLEVRDPDSTVSTAATVKGRLTAPAGGEIDVEWQRIHGDDNTELSITANGVALPALSPYASAIVGRPAVGGRFDLDFDLKRADGGATVDLFLTVEALELGRLDPDQAAAARPVDLAIALLENRAGVLRIARTVEQTSAGAGFEAGRKLSRMLSAELAYTARNPFEVLGGITGKPASALRRLDFLPGSAELITPSRQTLGALARALELRPRLALVMRPAYDPIADRDALARQQVRLHVVLASSARPPAQADDAPPDFSDEKVRAVLDEFASTRLPGPGRSAIAEENPDRGEAYYRAVFEALVANQNVDEAALRRLARYRVQSAVGELARLGIDAGRLVRHDSIDVRAGDERWIGVEIVPVPADRRAAPLPSTTAAPDEQ